MTLKMKPVLLNDPLKPTFRLLRLTYGLVPIVAGLDKFTNTLTDWEKYLNMDIAVMLPFSTNVFMLLVGIIEIIAGIIVLIKPSVGGYIVAAWLTLIAITLIADGNYYDIAVRDLVMAIGALSLARIAKTYKKVIIVK
jgi:uncharacterized membrane protein YphA (DoxX/SURF4 family)